MLCVLCDDNNKKEAIDGVTCAECNARLNEFLSGGANDE